MMKKKFPTIASLTLAAAACFALNGCALFGPSKNNSADSSGGKEYIPPVYTVDETLISGHTANDDIFLPENVTMREDSPLKGKTIYWLGSSVTYGASSGGDSMAEYLQALTGCISKKDAVSGTTIFDDGATENTGEKSYTRRLTNSTVFDKDEEIDAFICQISTNDAINNRLNKRGEATEIEDAQYYNDFDRATTLGGVEYIISYVLSVWNCPVYFYSGAYFGDSGTRSNSNPSGTEYAKLVAEVKEIAEKWNADPFYKVEVIDLYNDEDFNAQVSDEYYRWATSDAIHPKKAGYLQWWTPYIESCLLNSLV